VVKLGHDVTDLDRRQIVRQDAYEMHRPLVWFDVMAMAFVSLLLISNVIAQKLINVGPFTLTAAILIFPISYIFGDALTEVYGYARTRHIIWMGLLVNLFMAVMTWVVIHMPPAPGWPFQHEFETALGLVPRIVGASILGYWAGEFSNSYVLARLKLLMNGRMLWVRTISSTIVGEGVDTLIFVTVGFGGILSPSILVDTAIAAWIVKVSYEVAATPLTYLLIGFLKRQEGLDQFDSRTNFNPFKFSAP
jgi:uncharacterized integral membrane protein (TIGR00697 family)